MGLGKKAVAMENTSLRTVKVSILKVCVKSFSPAENTVVLEILYEGSASRKITRITRLGNAAILATKLIEEVAMHAGDDAAEFDGEMLYEANAVLHDEMTIKGKLVDFFRTLYAKSQQIRNAKNSYGYLDLIRSIQRVEMIP